MASKAKDATVEAPAERDLSRALAVLQALEWSKSGDGGSHHCPACGAAQPLDAANPRDWEKHADDCNVAGALSDLA